MAIEPFVWTQPKPRIVQYRGKRYALRLEQIFWRQLEAIALRRRRRLGHLVAELDESYQGPNLSSYIRGFCMVETEKEATHYRLASGSFDLIDIMRGAPAPAMLLSGERVILEANQAVFDWIGHGEQALRQMKFDDVFEPRVSRPMDETMDLLRSGQLKRTQLHVVHEGRVVTASLTALVVGHVFYCLVWLNTMNAAR